MNIGTNFSTRIRLADVVFSTTQVSHTSRHAKPRRIPSKQWRDCIKNIYEADPLCCQKCGGEMKIISFITDQQVIRQILKHLGLWTPATSRDPPNTNFSPKNHGPVYEIFDDLYAFNIQADDCPGYDESCMATN